MNTIYRINAEMGHEKDVQNKIRLWLFVVSAILMGVLVAGACNAGEVEINKACCERWKHWRKGDPTAICFDLSENKSKGNLDLRSQLYKRCLVDLDTADLIFWLREIPSCQCINIEDTLTKGEK